MRLTVDILLRAEHFLNAYKDRELNLRGFKIPVIENLSVLQDQFDVIDFSDNEIKKLDNFPQMKRLNAILLNNNYVTRIATNIGEYLPNLTALILTNNRILNLSEIDSIATLKKLEVLSLLENNVNVKTNYRLYTIYRIPTLKWLDFRKVSRTEREEATKYFKSAQGKSFLASIEQEGRTIAESGNASVAAAKVVLTDAQKAQVKAAIERATTKEEIDHIERQLKTNTFVFTEEGVSPVESSSSSSSGIVNEEDGKMCVDETSISSGMGSLVEA